MINCIRYNVCILGGSGNHARPEITNDIVSAILKTRADKFNPAVYWSREEQERRLDKAFKKWAARGVWNSAAAKVSRVLIGLADTSHASSCTQPSNRHIKSK